MYCYVLSSLEHIIERYMKEEIVAGQTLIAPLPKVIGHSLAK